MSVLATDFLDLAAHLPASSRVLLEDIAWDDYVDALDRLPENARLRLSFDRGRLEIMTLSFRHESLKALFAHLVAVLTQEAGVDFLSCGSTTFKSAAERQGTEPDDCYYIRHFSGVAGKDEIDLDVDPPPDLVVEIDISHPSLDKLPIYAGLGVAELWRHDGDRVTFYRLDGTGYVQTPSSVAFPVLPSAILAGFLVQGKTLGSNAMIRAFRQWVRDESAKRS